MPLSRTSERSRQRALPWTDPEDVIVLHEMGAIYRGFEASLGPLQAHIVKRIEAFERAHSF